MNSTKWKTSINKSYCHFANINRVRAGMGNVNMAVNPLVA